MHTPPATMIESVTRALERFKRDRVVLEYSAFDQAEIDRL